jgi:hypothetical protein
MSPGPDYWQDQIELRHDSATDIAQNLLYKRYWDPGNVEYNVERFRHDVIEKYCCPFGGCDCNYDEPVDLSDHFRIAHMNKNYRCPQCLKIFVKGSALMAHAEAAGGKCRVRETDAFGHLLEIISGGYLEADQVRQPRIVRLDQKAIVNKTDIAHGVMTTRFNWVNPYAPKKKDQDGDRQR